MKQHIGSGLILTVTYTVIVGGSEEEFVNPSLKRKLLRGIFGDC
jgi:hypothetical protein